MMKIHCFILYILIIIINGHLSCLTKTIPEKASLINAASVNGKFKVVIDNYDPETKIAIVNTPGWKPERKPYQFDGKKWIPLWSPFAPNDYKSSKE
jgi:hypothetical protein